MPRAESVPDRMWVQVPGLSAQRAREVAIDAVLQVRRNGPKLTGDSMRRLLPLSGEGYFGVRWLDNAVWFQEAGIRGFTQRSLAGKTVPMWIDDPTGAERRKNPHAETRTTESGRTQVLIFRRAALPGQRKIVKRRVGNQLVTVSTPMSYPGAPGRIALREAGSPYTTPGRVAGAIARANIGVRWYHPGLSPKNFVWHGLREAANHFSLSMGRVLVGTDKDLRQSVAA